jgi:phage-related protein
VALYTAGTAFLQVVPSMRGFHNEVRNQLRATPLEAKVKLTPDVDRAGFAAAAKTATMGKNQTVKVRAEIDRKSFADAVNSTSLLARNLAQMTVVPAGLVAATPVVMGLAAAAAQASTSLMLLPAVGLAVGAAMATAKVGTAGFGDAMKSVMDADPKKFNEALGQLSPNARAAAVEIRSMVPEIRALKNEVQDRLFRGFAGEIDALGRTYFPVLRTGMGGVAGEFNQIALGAGAFVRQAQTVRDVETIFRNTQLSVDGLHPGLMAILQILRDVAAVGSDLLPGLARGFSSGAEAAAEFIANARQTGQLRQWIQSGLDTLWDLIRTIVNLGTIVYEVFSLANVSGEGFARTMALITSEWLRWVRSAEGSQIIADVFRTLYDLAQSLAPLFGAIAGAIIGILLTIGPALPPLIAGVTDLVMAVLPMTAQLWELAATTLPALGGALSFLAPVLGPLVAAIIAAHVAMGIWNTVTAVGRGIQLAMAAATFIGQAAMLAYQIATSAGTAKLIAWAAAQWLVNAAMAANPIGLVVIAIAAFVAVLVLAWNHSETFRNVVLGAWEGIKAAAGAVWGWLTGTVFPSFIRAVQDVGGFFVWLWRDVVVPAWEGIKSAITVAGEVLKTVWDGIVFAAKLAFVIIATVVLTPLMLLWNEVAGLFMWGYENLIKPAWEGVTGAISTAWGIIKPIFSFIVEWVSNRLTAGTNRFRDVCREAWESIRAAIDIAWRFIRDNIWQPILDFINQWMMPGFRIMRDFAIDCWNLMRDGINTAWQWILNNIWNPILAFINTQLVPRFQWLENQVNFYWTQMKNGLQAGWDWIRDNIWNPIVQFITVTIPNGFQRGVDAIGRLWDGVKAKLRDPLQAAINVVWNNGIVKVWNMVADLVGLSTKLQPYNLPGYKAGGPITGGTPGKDSVLFRGMPGEYVLTTRAVNNLGGVAAVEMLHQMWREGGSPRRKSDQFLPGYAAGGPIGGARASGSASVTTATGSAQAVNQSPFALVGEWWSAITNGISQLSGMVSSAGQWGAEAVVGFGKKIGTEVVDALKRKVAEWLATFVGVGGGGPMGGGVVAGAVGTMMQVLRAVFPGLALISGFRPGSITATGNRSYHSMGRAVDLPPRMDVFNWIRANFGANTKELIFSPAGGAQIHNGRPHVYTGITRSMHFDHVHWAMDRGGVAPGTGVMLKDVIAPERVLSPRQTESFDRLVSHLTGSRTRTLRDPGVDTPLGSATAGGPYIGQVVVPVPDGASVDQTIDAIMTRARHEGKRGGRYGRP